MLLAVGVRGAQLGERIVRHASQRTVGAMGRITLHQGDITRDAEADAIVNAANSSLLGGGGVDGAIHRAAGPELLRECRALRRLRDRRREAHGRRRAAGATRDPCRRTGLARGFERRAGAAGACYRRAIELAAEHGDARVAFPAISTGVYSYPLDEAAVVAVRATREALDAHPEVEEARFWLFGEDAYRAFEAAL